LLGALDGSPPDVDARETQTVEAGRAASAAKWEIAGPVILLSRFGRFLSNKTFNCRVADTTRSWVRYLGAAGATLDSWRGTRGCRAARRCRPTGTTAGEDDRGPRARPGTLQSPRPAA